MKIDNKTWESAAEEAVSSIFDVAISNGLQTPETLCKFMRHKFDEALNKTVDFNSIPEGVLFNSTGSLWSFVARHALHILRYQEISPTKEEIVSTLIRKQRDYGPENISRFGDIGLLIRMHDKIARLENIMAKTNNDFNRAISINSVQDETIVDTLIDIIGYSAIAIMWSTIDENNNRAFLYPMGEEYV
jgi:hypothetical protein